MKRILPTLIFIMFFGVNLIRGFDFWECHDFALNLEEAGIKTALSGISIQYYTKKQYTGLPNGFYFGVPVIYRIGLSQKEDVFIKTGFDYTSGAVGKRNIYKFFLKDPTFGLNRKFTVKSFPLLGRVMLKLPLFSPDYSTNNGAFELRFRVMYKKDALYYGFGYDMRFKNSDNINYGDIIYLMGAYKKEINPRITLLFMGNLDFVFKASYKGDLDSAIAPPIITAGNSSALLMGIILRGVYIINSTMNVQSEVIINSSNIGVTLLYTYKGLRL